MDAQQIRLKLFLDQFEIDIENIPREQYREICGIIYLAEQKEVYPVQSGMIQYDPNKNECFSPWSHESGGYPSENLSSNLAVIRNEIVSCKKNNMKDDSYNTTLSTRAIERINELKQELKEKKLEELLKANYDPNKP
jgi:hypothetical protein